SNRFNTSASWIFLRVMSVLDRKAVGLGEHADRMERLTASALLDLERGQWTVCGHALRRRGRDALEQRLREFHRQLEVLLLHSPRAVDPRALLDCLHSRAGQPQDVD